MAELEALGAEVRVYAGDVADPASLAAVLDEIRADPAAAARCGARRIRHRGRAGDGARRRARSPTSCGRSSAARSLLDRLTRDDPIELFLLFSSATTLLGAPGQGVYVAANIALEALARRRRAQGRPALGGRLGADRGHRLSRGSAGDAGCPGAPARCQADAVGASPGRAAGARRKRLGRSPPLPRPAGTRRGASCRSWRRRCSPIFAPMAAPRRATTR